MATEPADPQDSTELTLTPEQAAELMPLQKHSQPRERRRSRTKFIMLPYEHTLAAAGRLQNAQLAVLVEIANQVFKTRQNPTPLPNAALRAAGLSRKAKLRALRQLEKVGLVKVSWRGRKSPLVSIQQQ
jgi:hypothetical protein